ncbi:MAG: hypothetical protein VX044_09400 [Planctomycetota bacterium]|nr:hypothetical protein [Planctomycetota bacterium]
MKLLIVLLGAHVALGVTRVPDKVIGRRLDEVAAYREQGAAAFLCGRARLSGAEELTWLLEHTDKQSVVLWRWPADGALEFTSALLAPRLVVDERLVPADATVFAGRPIASGVVPSGARGAVVVQGTPDGGLALTAR